MNGALALVETLYQNGVDHIFALPGTTITDIYDVFYDFQGIRLVTARHEQVAGFMADGYARITGRPGVCMASRGPGAANLAIAAHNAYAESCPMVVIVGQVSEDIYEKNAFEEVELVSFFRPITKWATEIHDARRIPEIINRAMYVAKSGKPGPVMVSIPLNIQQHQGAYCVPEPIPVTRYSAAKEQITATVELIRSKSRPVILAGSGLQWSGGTDKLLEFAERLSIYVCQHIF